MVKTYVPDESITNTDEYIVGIRHIKDGNNDRRLFLNNKILREMGINPEQKLTAYFIINRNKDLIIRIRFEAWNSDHKQGEETIDEEKYIQ